jgi:Xaa-Pro aminopeptidase
MNLELLQQALREQGVDGWLFVDFHRRDPIAYRILSLPQEAMATRRWYYLVPAQGTPRKLAHRIESSQLDSLPGDKSVYASWQEEARGLQEMLQDVQTLAMQYSPDGRLPAISLADAGTVERIRSLGKHVVSSANLIQYFEARWSPAALQLHLEAGQAIDRIMAAAFQEIARRVRSDGYTNEYEMQQWILQQFAGSGLLTQIPPIVAANRNSGNPHYLPGPTLSAPIRSGDFVLLDLWAKRDKPGAVYYDVTWVGFLGESPPESIRRVFEVVKAARDRAIDTVQDAVRSGRTLRGWEVDRAARDLISERGYGEFFLHRTGHSIGEEVHGNGANMDDLETHDDRQILPFTGFSIEPGIYLPEFGVRSEVNVFVDDREARVTGAVQNGILCIPAAAPLVR